MNSKRTQRDSIRNSMQYIKKEFNKGIEILARKQSKMVMEIKCLINQIKPLF